MLKLLEFNQDNSCLAVSSDSSFSIYNCDPFDKCYSCKDNTIVIAEMLFSTSLIAIVDSKLGNNCLRIINTKKNSTICELSFPQRILNIKINRKRIIIILTNELLIYDISCMKLLKKIELIDSNKTLNNSVNHISCNLSSSDLSILAFQQINSNILNNNDIGNNENDNNNNSENVNGNFAVLSGIVIIFDALKLTPISIINCHKSGLQTLTLSENGVLLATASIKGTIIRIFNSLTGIKLYEFRRGSLPATICSLTFNSNNSILACSSDTGTVHFFQVPDYISQIGITKESNTNIIKSNSLNEITSTELPNSSELTNDENEEVQKLMEFADNPSNNKNLSTFEKTKRLTGFLWSKSKQYLPQQINSIFEPKRDFAFIKLPTIGYSIIGLLDNTCYIATMDGMFLQYNIPIPPPIINSKYNVSSSPSSSSLSSPSIPLECKLIKHHHIPN